MSDFLFAIATLALVLMAAVQVTRFILEQQNQEAELDRYYIALQNVMNESLQAQAQQMGQYQERTREDLEQHWTRTQANLADYWEKLTTAQRAHEQHIREIMGKQQEPLQ